MSETDMKPCKPMDKEDWILIAKFWVPIFVVTVVIYLIDKG